MPDRKALSELTGAIYDCVFRPELWSDVLTRIQLEVGAVSSYLLIHDTDPRSAEMSLLVEHDVDTPMRLRYDQHYKRLNPLLSHLGSFGDGEVYCCSDLVVQPEYLGSTFYQEWAAPQEWFDYAGVTLTRKNRTSVAIGFTRGGAGNVFDDDSLDVIRGLAPHLTRAAEIQSVIERERQSRRDLTSLIGSVRCGFLIVNSGMRVLEANPAAEALLRKNEALTCRERTLAAREATNTLQGAVRSACGRDTAHSGTTLPISRGPGRRPLILQVIPLRCSEPDGMFHALLPATAAIFLIDPEEAPAAALDIFAAIHQLTAAERQVLEKLAAGCSPSEIARALSVGTATVRTHLHRLFDKTGTPRQAELLTLLQSFTPPVLPG